MFYVQKPPRCEAMLVTETNAAEVAAWCGGMALPDGSSVLYKVNGQWQQAPCVVGEYLTLDLASGIHARMSAEDFERQWAAAPE